MKILIGWVLCFGVRGGRKSRWKVVVVVVSLLGEKREAEGVRERKRKEKWNGSWVGESLLEDQG